jgi:TPR repeat protein
MHVQRMQTPGRPHPRGWIAGLYLLLLSIALPAEERGLRPLTVAAPSGQAIVTITSSRALIIGNAAYKDQNWQSLQGVVHDVTKVAEALKQQGFDVTLAQDLTHSDMIRVIDAFVADQASDPTGRVVFYYAGHGWTRSGSQPLGYLVPIDAPAPTEKGFIPRAYPIQTIKIKSMEMAARHVLFAFDCCFGGTIFTPLRGATPTTTLHESAEPVRLFMTAGAANESVPDISYFCSEFIAGIAGAADVNHDGWVTGRELSFYVTQSVRDRAAAASIKLSPQAGVSEMEGYNRGDFVFATTRTSGAPVRTQMPVNPQEPDALTIRPSLPSEPQQTTSWPLIWAGVILLPVCIVAVWIVQSSRKPRAATSAAVDPQARGPIRTHMEPGATSAREDEIARLTAEKAAAEKRVQDVQNQRFTEMQAVAESAEVKRRAVELENQRLKDERAASDIARLRAEKAAAEARAKELEDRRSRPAVQSDRVRKSNAVRKPPPRRSPTQSRGSDDGDPEDGDGLDTEDTRNTSSESEDVKSLRDKASLGDVDAMNELAKCLFEGIGTRSDPKAGVDLLREAIEEGSLNALFNLGHCHVHGLGVEKDELKGVECYRKAAEDGHQLSMHALGTCAKNGVGGKADPYEAVRWFRKAADKGCIPAQVDLALCLLTGEGTGKDEKYAAEWLCEMADLGDPCAQYIYGCCLGEGRGAARDLSKAVIWLRKSARQGYVLAEYALGWHLEFGFGVDANAKEAVKWYERSAGKNHDQAQNSIGNCCELGIGRTKNQQEAVSWYRKSAEQNNAEAQYRLARCYETGTGIKQDQLQAEHWYRKAADNGYPHQCLATLHEYADDGSIDAMFTLGQCNERGLGLPINTQAAITWYKKAANAGHATAKACVERLSTKP